MSTHCAIIQKVKGGYRGVYCHFDGYYSTRNGTQPGVGMTLEHHYNTANRVTALIDCGDLIALPGSLAQAQSERGRAADELGHTAEENAPKSARTITGVLKAIQTSVPYVWVFDGKRWRDRAYLCKPRVYDGPVGFRA